jgi:cupin superfamily acireductone dioxygenase involved in methionine salvage
MKHLLRQPLFHFLLIGALLFLLFEGVNTSKTETTDIIIDQSDIERLLNTWGMQWKRKPTMEELTNLLESNIKQEIFYLEALQMNLDHNDEIIKRRLSQKMEFLSNDLASMTKPSDSELKDYFEAHLDKYLTPHMYSFYQIPFTLDGSGRDYFKKAQSVLKNNQDATVEFMKTKGDRLMFPNEYQRASSQELAQQLGSDFPNALKTAPTNVWVGPIDSGFGTHLVFITNIESPRKPEFESIRRALERDFAYEKEKLVNQAIYDQMKKGYRIKINIENSKEIPAEFIDHFQKEFNSLKK